MKNIIDSGKYFPAFSNKSHPALGSMDSSQDSAEMTKSFTDTEASTPSLKSRFTLSSSAQPSSSSKCLTVVPELCIFDLWSLAA